MRIERIIAALCLVASLGGGAGSAAFAESEGIAFVKSMGLGTNLGNTMEATGAKEWTNIRQFETAWGQPVTTKAIIDNIAAAGFKSIRIPVAWSNMMADDYTINPELMARVEQIADWALADDMYVIVNLHWDGGWLAGFGKKYKKTLPKYEAIWTQVSARFKDKSEKLILESLNEEGNWPDLWNNYTGIGFKDEAYETLNKINQRFVDIVRGSGGNNATRHLLIAGYNTDFALTSDPMFEMPKDPANRCIVSVHYYTPPTFAILEKDASWGKASRTWGTGPERESLKADFAMLKEHFLDKGIPVIVGEYGCPTGRSKERKSVEAYLEAVASEAWKLGICPMLWDCNGHLNRVKGTFNDPVVGENYKKILTQPRNAY